MYDYYRGSSSYEDAVRRQLTVLETTNLANMHALHEMDSDLRNAIQANTDAIQDATIGIRDDIRASAYAQLAMGAEIRNDIQTNTNAIQDMAFGLNCAIRESTYTVVASQAMLTQTFKQGFNAVNNMLDLGFSMVSSKLDAMTDRICSKLDEIHDILNNPLLTASRELYRRALDEYKRGLYEEALQSCTGAVEKNKTDFISWYLLGHIYLFGAGKFSNVVDVDKAEEAFFNAAKYIDYDLGKSDEANALGSEIYYYLGYARLIKSNDLLVENNNAESVKKMEEAESASREASRLSVENLLAVYEQAKELHFLGRDDEALQLIEKLIRADKNYALRACNDKNFESLWDRIDTLIKTLRDELADKLAQGFSSIRALGRKGNEQLAEINFPDEEQVREFEQFYHSELIHKDFETDKSLMQIICNDFDSLATGVFEKNGIHKGIYISVIRSDAVIKNIHSERISWKNKFDGIASNVELEIGQLESMLEKEHDYFSVRDKYSNFCGSNDNSPDFTPQRDNLTAMINQVLNDFDEKCGKLKKDIKIVQVWFDTQKVWSENKDRLRENHVSELVRECNAIRDAWKKRIDEMRLVTISPTEEQMRKFETFLLSTNANYFKFHSHEVGIYSDISDILKEIKSVRDGKSALKSELDKLLLLIEETLAPFESLQDKDYFFVSKRSKEFTERHLHEPSSSIERTFSELDTKVTKLKYSRNRTEDYISKCEGRLQYTIESHKRYNRSMYISCCIISVICFVIQYFISDNHLFWGGLIFLASAFFGLLSGIFGGILWIGGAVLLFSQGHPVLGVISSLTAIVAFSTHNKIDWYSK